jgi:Hint domain
LIGSGSVTIDAGSTLGVQGTVAGGETIVFSGSGGYLYLGNPDSVAGSITNFSVGDTIDLKGVTSVNYSDGVLSFDGGSFALSPANGSTATASISGDNVVISAALCFCANTLILTPSGERPVQELAAGDLVITWRGGARRVDRHRQSAGHARAT